MVPVIGSAIAEAVAYAIPNQRIDRVERYLLVLRDAIAANNVSFSQESEHQLGLLEDGAWLAARAISSERRERIAKAVAHGMANEETSKLYHRRVLEIVGELDDQEFAILTAYGSWSPWSAISKLRPPMATAADGPEVQREVQLFRAAEGGLERRGLLYFKPKLTELNTPEYRWTGEREGDLKISELGRIVLEASGVGRDLDAEGETESALDL